MATALSRGNAEYRRGGQQHPACTPVRPRSTSAISALPPLLYTHFVPGAASIGCDNVKRIQSSLASSCVVVLVESSGRSVSAVVDQTILSRCVVREKRPDGGPLVERVWGRVRVHNPKEAGAAAFMARELVGGGALAPTGESHGPLAWRDALTHMLGIAEGLREAARHGIIHRDIKPQNILLTADHSTAKIADFGVGRFSIADSPITRVGTNIYAPPEHSPLNPGRGTERLTAAADIYSLAKTVYTLLTRETPRSFANAAIDSLPESARREDWAEELLRVVKRATSESPAERHQTVEEFWNDLAGVRDIPADGEYST